jgi:hypothetical protein
MLCISNLRYIPPGGYSATVPETGALIKGGNYLEWRFKMREHYDANNLPVGIQWEQQIQNLICTQKPAGFCEECRNGQVKPTSKEHYSRGCRGCKGGRKR